MGFFHGETGVIGVAQFGMGSASIVGGVVGAGQVSMRYSIEPQVTGIKFTTAPDSGSGTFLLFDPSIYNPFVRPTCCCPIDLA